MMFPCELPISLTAFQSLFVTVENEAGWLKRPWYSSSIRNGRKPSVSGLKMEGLPAVPRATLTGMQTLFAGAPVTQSLRLLTGTS